MKTAREESVLCFTHERRKGLWEISSTYYKVLLKVGLEWLEIQRCIHLCMYLLKYEYNNKEQTRRIRFGFQSHPARFVPSTVRTPYMVGGTRVCRQGRLYYLVLGNSVRFQLASLGRSGYTHRRASCSLMWCRHYFSPSLQLVKASFHECKWVIINEGWRAGCRSVALVALFTCAIIETLTDGKKKDALSPSPSCFGAFSLRPFGQALLHLFLSFSFLFLPLLVP